MNKTMQQQELDNLINMLESDLAEFRERAGYGDINYNPPKQHRLWRMFLTLAQECRELRGIIEQAGLSSLSGNDAKPDAKSGGKGE